MAEDRRGTTEYRGGTTEDRGGTTEDRGAVTAVTEDRGGTTEDRGETTKDRGTLTEDRILIFYCHNFVQNGVPYLEFLALLPVSHTPKPRSQVSIQLSVAIACMHAVWYFTQHSSLLILCLTNK